MRFRDRLQAFILSSGRPRAARRCTLLLLSGLFLAAPLALPVAAQDAAANLRPIPDPIARHVSEAAQRFDLPEHWLRAVMHVESAGDSMAVSSAGAMGLMQIMPDTWAELRVQYGFGSDPFAPRDNILAGSAYLREMLNRYGNIGAMLAAYNAGPGRYDDYLSGLRELPAETRSYVATLAPMLDGNVALPRLAAAAPRVTDWREASLFIPLSGSSPADTLSPEQGGVEAADANLSPSAPLRSLRSEALFVARSGVEVSP